MQDKSPSYATTYKVVLRLPGMKTKRTPLIAQRRRNLLTREGEKCASCTERTCQICSERISLNEKLADIMQSEESKEVEKINVLLKSTNLVPDTERVARIISSLGTQRDQATSMFIQSLYEKSNKTGPPSLNLKNVFLDHLLSNPEFKSTISPSQLLSTFIDPLSRHSTVSLLIKHTDIHKLHNLINKIPLPLLKTIDIQMKTYPTHKIL